MSNRLQRVGKLTALESVASPLLSSSSSTNTIALTDKLLDNARDKDGDIIMTNTDGDNSSNHAMASSASQGVTSNTASDVEAKPYANYYRNPSMVPVKDREDDLESAIRKTLVEKHIDICHNA